tara:strand:- start:11401 stop:12486 length:1086 start_codon:yes stop_codon:yes gene_type:complete
MHSKNISPDLKNIEEKLNSTIEKGIAYLEDHQLPNGEFLMYMSGDDAMQGWNLPESCVFPAALIGNCLLPLRGQEKVENILVKAAKFLHYQMGRGGTWNHYTILHRYRNLCPQDLDDTACVSHFLKTMDFDVPTERNQQLILDNRRSDGLFYTWFTFRFRFNKNPMYWYLAAKELKYLFKSLVFWQQAGCERHDVDTVVNANILYYMGIRKETEPIIPYLINVIKKGKENDCDKWYRNTLTVYYFITRNYYKGILKLGEIRSEIIDRILSEHQKDGSFRKSDLETALALSSLIHLKYNGHEIEEGIHYLIGKQLTKGNWKRWAFYYSGPTKPSSFGSEELTTAFCLESLALYKKALSKKGI